MNGKVQVRSSRPSAVSTRRGGEGKVLRDEKGWAIRGKKETWNVEHRTC
jgi:hypothetical protein